MAAARQARNRSAPSARGPGRALALVPAARYNNGMTEAAYIALLRGVNVGGHAKVAMSDLRDLLAGLGFGDVRSLLQSGNLVFRSDGQAASDLEHLLETEAARRLDLHTDFLVRTADEWVDVVARNPFPAEAERDPSHLLVMFLKQAPAETAVEALREAVTGPEVIRAEGRHAYITYPAGIGRSRLTNTLIESKLGTRGTGRNWNTVLKLAALVRA
jgi:uncharacterized protein (DUF1697 family)